MVTFEGLVATSKLGGGIEETKDVARNEECGNAEGAEKRQTEEPAGGGGGGGAAGRGAGNRVVKLRKKKKILK